MSKEKKYRLKIPYPGCGLLKGALLEYNPLTGKWHQVIGSSNGTQQIFYTYGVSQPYNYPEIFKEQ